MNLNGAEGFGNQLGTRTFLNQGTVNKLGGGSFPVTVQNPIVLSNTGTLNVIAGTFNANGGVSQVSGSTLTGGTWNVTGTMQIAGANLQTIAAAAAITLNGAPSSFAAINPLVTNNGSLTLAGGRDFTAAGAVTNNGTLALGPGSTLAATGTFTQGSGGTLLTQIAGPSAATEFGSVTATGAATIAGTLTPQIVNSYDPPFTQSFVVVTGSTRSGTFGTFTRWLDTAGRPLRARYGTSTAIIGVAPLAPSTPDLAATSDSGVSATDDLTKINTPTFTGAAEDGTTVRLYSDGVPVGRRPRPVARIALRASVALADGAHVMTVKAEDGDPDLSDASTSLSVTIDTIAPTAPAAPDLVAKR
jgi:hypothetical protein